jgi:hypothetical protein
VDAYRPRCTATRFALRTFDHIFHANRTRC